MPFVRRVCTVTELAIGKPGAKSAPALLMTTKAGPGMPVVLWPALAKSGMDPCVAVAAH